MPETTENFHRLPNPNYNGAAFEDETRTTDLSAEQGIKALYSPLKRGGLWKVRTFLFAREKWPELSACEAWLKDNREQFNAIGPGLQMQQCFAAGFVQGEKRTTPTPAELAAIQQYALEELQPEQVYTRTMLLANDAWGKHDLRLSRGFLQTLIDTTPGKSLLLGHPSYMGVPPKPLGRFYDAEEFRDAAGTTHNRAKFYIVKTDANAHARAQIDGGVWQQTSIGFQTDWQQCSVCGQNLMDPKACSHVPGKSYPAKQVAPDMDLSPEPDPDIPGNVRCGCVFRGRGSTLEGSIVYLSELNGTQILASQAMLAGDFGRAKTLMLGSDDTGLTGAPPATAADVTPGDSDQTAEALQAKEEEDDMEIAELEAQVKAAEDKAAALEAQVGTLQAALDAANAKTATLDKQVAEGAEFRAFAVTELETYAGLVSRDADLAAFKELAGEDLSGMAPAKVLSFVADWRKAYDEAHPSGRQATTTHRDPQTGEVLDGTPPPEGSHEVRTLALM